MYDKHALSLHSSTAKPFTLRLHYLIARNLSIYVGMYLFLVPGVKCPAILYKRLAFAGG